MDDNNPHIQEIRRIIQDLSHRLDRVERRVELLSGHDGSAKSVGNAETSPIVLRTEKDLTPPHPNFESRIGVHWLNRVGILAVLVAVSLFLKFAFEGGWIGPVGRTSIGLIAGIAITAWSEWFRNRRYHFFSFSLKALGLGVLYLSLWAAFQVYNLIPWSVALLAMVIVTGSAAALAVWQSSETLALFALIGGFLTPVLLYTGQSREIELFSYIAILNAATLVLASYRAWRRLLLVSVVATSILYFSWYAIFYRSDELAPTLAFATLFFITFTLSPLAESVIRPEASTHSKILAFASLLNPSFYFLALYLMLGRSDKTTLGGCAVGLGAVYAVLGGFLGARIRPRKGYTLDREHLAISTAFVTLAIAVHFGSLGISLGWFMQAAALVAMGFWWKSAFIRWEALVLISLAIAKVFVYDIWGLQQEYRIVSFFLLGMLLFVVSFLYQRDLLKLS